MLCQTSNPTELLISKAGQGGDADHTPEMLIVHEEPVCQEFPEFLPPDVLHILIRGLPAVDATVAMKSLRAVRPTLASGISCLDCDADAQRLLEVGDLEVRELDVRGRFYVSFASHGGPSPEETVNVPIFWAVDDD